jgi:translocator protein
LRRKRPLHLCHMDPFSPFMMIAFGAASFGAAATGAIFRPGDWYKQLDKPRWRPPDWLFAPVWTVLYVLIALSGWLVWREAGFAGAPLPLAVYALQLLLNAAWTPIFFGLHRAGLALMEIVILLGSIVATMVLFYPESAAAAWLLVPYLVWVSFAAALNFAIWRRNRATAAAKGAR